MKLLSSAQKADLKQEYDRTGMLSQSFPLGDLSVLTAVKKDEPTFEKAIERFRSQSLFRVPYRLTSAIMTLAHDKNLVEIVQMVLGGSHTPWVVWGPIMHLGTPHGAYKWHVDIESWHWPTVTVIVGLENCNPENATTCIPYSHLLNIFPWSEANNSVDASVQASAESSDSRCCSMRSFEDFRTGNFYVFNGKIWHRGPAISVFQDRKILLLHYQRADAPRIPYMYNYEENLWFRYPATYGEGADTTMQSRDDFDQMSYNAAQLASPNVSRRFRTDLHSLPDGHAWAK